MEVSDNGLLDCTDCLYTVQELKEVVGLSSAAAIHSFLQQPLVERSSTS